MKLVQSQSSPINKIDWFVELEAVQCPLAFAWTVPTEEYSLGAVIPRKSHCYSLTECCLTVKRFLSIDESAAIIRVSTKFESEI